MSQDFGSIILLLVFAFSLIGCLFVIIRLYSINAQSQVKSRLDNIGDSRRSRREQTSRSFSASDYFTSGPISGIRGQINRALAIFSTEELSIKISSANWPISDIEFILTRLIVCLVALFLGWVITGSILGGLALAVLAYFIPGILLERSIATRRKKFQDLLVDFLVLVRGALLVGSSLPQALSLAAKEISAPVSEEFNQVIKETQLGLTLPEALHNLEARMQCDDLKIVVTGILLNLELGGNLSTIIDAAITTIRDRMLLLGEVRSLTAYSRYVGLFLTALPILTALLLFIINPSFFQPIKTERLSQIAYVFAVLGVIMGNFFIRRLTRIRV